MPSHVTAAIQEPCLLSHNSPEHCLSGNVQMEAVSEQLQACIYCIPEDGLQSRAPMFLSQALGKLLKIQDCESNKESSEWV